MSVNAVPESDVFGAAKAVRELRAEHDAHGHRFDDAFFGTDCPACHRHVNALIKDGPDPVFAILGCPQCGHEWEERVS